MRVSGRWTRIVPGQAFLLGTPIIYFSVYDPRSFPVECLRLYKLFPLKKRKIYRHIHTRVRARAFIHVHVYTHMYIRTCTQTHIYIFLRIGANKKSDSGRCRSVQSRYGNYDVLHDGHFDVACGSSMPWLISAEESQLNIH